jgi:hypothetical protein
VEYFYRTIIYPVEMVWCDEVCQNCMIFNNTSREDDEQLLYLDIIEHLATGYILQQMPIKFSL